MPDEVYKKNVNKWLAEIGKNDIRKATTAVNKRKFNDEDHRLVTAATTEKEYWKGALIKFPI
ncbi:hypothetical protein PG984_010151 [Apiospora sp. TS-2023a]